jgi:hypothetical protein
MNLTPREAEQLYSGDFGKHLLRTACDYCIPIFWSTEKGGRHQIDNNGTAFILDCGSRPFVVTAAHVYESYMTLRSRCSNICPQLGDLRFPMEERILGYDGSSQLDIVTFSISAEEISLLKKPVLRGNTRGWPPPLPKEREGALFAGLPGHQRIDTSSAECSFGFYASFTPISSVSNRHFGCVFDRSKWIDTFGKGLPAAGYDLGGISGAPVLVVDESTAGILSWHLAGVAYNASNVIGEIMLAHHAAFINKDGTLSNL